MRCFWLYLPDILKNCSFRWSKSQFSFDRHWWRSLLQSRWVILVLANHPPSTNTWSTLCRRHAPHTSTRPCCGLTLPCTASYWYSSLLGSRALLHAQTLKLRTWLEWSIRCRGREIGPISTTLKFQWVPLLRRLTRRSSFTRFESSCHWSVPTLTKLSCTLSCW